MMELLVLGSGGPFLNVRRASSAFVVTLTDGRRILVDAGGGAFDRLGAAGGRARDLDLGPDASVDHGRPALIAWDKHSVKECHHRQYEWPRRAATVTMDPCPRVMKGTRSDVEHPRSWPEVSSVSLAAQLP